MITPNNNITEPSKTFDGIWISNLQIMAPYTNKPVMATMVVSPYNSNTGEISNKRKVLTIPDIYSAATTNTNIAAAMQNIYAYVQSMVASGSIQF